MKLATEVSQINLLATLLKFLGLMYFKSPSNLRDSFMSLT